MLANFGVDLQEGDFFCSPTSFSTHPIVITCRNLAHNKDQPLDGVTSEMTDGSPDGKTLDHVSRHLKRCTPHPPPPLLHAFNTMSSTTLCSFYFDPIYWHDTPVHGRIYGYGLAEGPVPSSCQV
jgi:hypothetical protein